MSQSIANTSASNRQGRLCPTGLPSLNAKSSDCCTTAYAVLLFVLAFGGDVRATGAELKERLQPLIDVHQGQVAVAVKHLGTGEGFVHRAEEPMPTASLIKLPLMVAAYQAIDEGRVDADALMTLRAEDQVPGSGVLTPHFSAGMSLSLRDAIRLMIAFSDNTATNLVIDQVGLPATNAAMQTLGLSQTRLNSKVYRRETSLDPQRSQTYGLGSTTAGEMIVLLEKLHRRQLMSESASKAMLAHLRTCDDRQKFARFLPKLKIAHKTGTVNAVRTDAGILETPAGPIAVCVLTAENKDQSWGDDNAAEILCGRIAEAVFQHFNPHVDPAAPSDGGPLKIGAQGELVEALQRTLNARMQPSPDLGIDGDFGPATEAAVIAFQTAKSLPSNGVVGPETWKALGPIIDAAEADAAAAAEPPLVKAAPDAIGGRPFVTCKAWAVVDGATGELLGGERAEEALPNASTTKMMTAYLVIRYVQEHPETLAERVTFSSRADGTLGSTAGVRTGEVISVRDLLYGLLLPSGNDASVALAEHFGSRLSPGSTADDAASNPHDRFIARMNATARDLGMTGTSYANPHGLHAEEHASTPLDLIRLARAALELPLFAEIVNTPRHECVVTGPSGYERTVRWKNTNKLLEIEGYDGVKTGTTTPAGACLVSRGRRDGRTLLVAVLGSTSGDARYTDTRNLFRWGWQELGGK